LGQIAIRVLVTQGDQAIATATDQRVAHLEAKLAEVTEELKVAQERIAQLRSSYRRALEQLALMRRRIFSAKAERVEAAGLQLSFERLLAQVQELEAKLVEAGDSPSETQTDVAQDADPKDATTDNSDKSDESDATKGKGKTRARRKLSESDLPLIRVEVSDPQLEGVAERIGFEESYRLGYERGGMRRIQVARVVYKATEQAPSASTIEAVSPATAPDDASTAGCDDALQTPTASVGCDEVAAPVATADNPTSDSTDSARTADAKAAPEATPKAKFVTAALPKELFRRSLLAPALVAHILITKFMMGVPFYRLEQKFALEGAGVDRSTMCRYAEDTGATLGAIVEAARKEAFATAFCLSTDATGAAIQPGPLIDGKRRPCRKGHFFVTLADLDHVFFEYTEKHTSQVVCEMFKGFRGYIQADAHAVYDALFRGVPRLNENGQMVPDPDAPIEVGCWSHLRRKGWEAAVCKHQIGIDMLQRIDAIFGADRLLWKFSPSKRKALRDVTARPLVDDFFAWVKAQHALVLERGLVNTALGYAIRQEQPLRRFLDDGRLRMENNGAERNIRPIAAARHGWLFFGSDDHAQAAANLFSLIASCKLHRLDPEAYFTDIIRVMPYWPRDRYLELSPKYWAATRARLNPKELELPLGHITVPPPAPKQQSASN
jgi:transposase